MRRTTTALVAGEPGTTVTPDPIEVTYHMHGDPETAYTDDAYYATSTLDGVLGMDRTAPEGDFDSQQLKNYSQGPNASCSGNGLFLTWKGWMGRGTAVGEATFAFDVVGSTGGEVTVEVYADTDGQCNEEYIEPVATTDAVTRGRSTTPSTTPDHRCGPARSHPRTRPSTPVSSTTALTTTRP